MRIARDITVIPPTCKESFLPTGDSAVLDEFGVMMAGISELRKGFRAERARTTDMHYVKFTTVGNAVVETPGATFRLGPGDVFVAPAGNNAHRHAPEPDTECWKLYWIRLANNGHWAFLENSPIIHRPSDAVPRIAWVMEGIVRESHASDDDATRMRQLLSEMLVHLLRRELDMQIPLTELTTRNRLNDLWARVESMLAQPWETRTLAREAGMSRTHFFRWCRKVYDMSPNERLTSLRMQRAEILLRNTDYPVARVAEMVGYTDPFAFSTAFRRYSGKSPRTYRRAETVRAVTVIDAAG